MTKKYTTLFITQRGEIHQKVALEAAPDDLKVVMRRTNNKDEIISLVGDAEFLISERVGAIDADIIAAGKNLKLIQRLGVQTWDIDLEAARKAGIPVCFLPVKTCEFVAEHMVLQMLGLARRIRDVMQITAEAGDWGMPPKRCNENYFAFNWSKRTQIDTLRGANVGILGYGEIGAELASRLKGFGCTILYNKRRPLPHQVEAKLGLTYVSREELAHRSDFIGCLLPNLPELNQSIDADFFTAMKPGAFFTHCGAPGIVNEPAMIDALKSGHLAGGALDCYTYEPMRPDDPLLELARDPSQNIILTPHTAAGTVAVSKEERMIDYTNIVAILNEEELHHQIV